MKSTRTTFALLTALLLALLPLYIAARQSVSTTPARPKPNIILIVADDLGYGDLGAYGANYYTRNDRLAAHSPKHMTDFEIDDALRVIEKYSRAGQPFFLNSNPFDVHAPYEPAPDEYMNLYRGKVEGDKLLYRAMTSHLDASVGRIVAKLAELGIADDTLVVFTSDNGPVPLGSAGGLRGGKTNLYEGGITVPMIAAWQGMIKPGTVSKEFAHTNDLLPTFCELAGAKLPARIKFDGQSLASHLTTNAPLGERGTVFWQLDLIVPPRSGRRPLESFMVDHSIEAVRRGKWKMIAKAGDPQELYDLEVDPGERKNLIAEQPELRRELRSELSTWLRQARSEASRATK